MLIRVTGGSEGVAEYLVEGQMQGRELSRDELDKRVVLDGDLELTDAVINGMENVGDKYLHITLGFKEDEISDEFLRGVVDDFKKFAMSAYDDDEFNFYAEAHLPKVKSYTDRKASKLVERKPHIHIVIPRANLLSGTVMDLLYKPVLDKRSGHVAVSNDQLKWIDAFQECVNAKYGLSSPKDNRRHEFTGESEIISRYKGDFFQGSAKNLKKRILSEVLDRRIEDYKIFKEMLAEHGETRTRNAGEYSEYQNVKPAGQAKGINLKDYVFSREFIEKPEVEKRKFLADEGRMNYESPQPARSTAPELAARLKEWHEIRARELKYINSGSRKLYAAYRAAGLHEKREILADRAARFYAKHQAVRALGGGVLKTFNDKKPHNERPDYDRISAERAKPGQHAAALYQSDLAKSGREASARPIASLRNLSSVGMVHHERSAQVLLQPHAPDRLGRERAADFELRRARTGDSRAHGDQELGSGKRGGVISVVSQLLAHHHERVTEAKDANLSEFAEIKRELDARRLLAELSQSHGVIVEKYHLTKGNDGSDRIRCGTRNLNVSDFLTQELKMPWAVAAKALRDAYARQRANEPEQDARREPLPQLWAEFQEDRMNIGQELREVRWSLQRTDERDRRQEIKKEFDAKKIKVQRDRSMAPAARRAAVSIARMERLAKEVALRDRVKIEREQLKAEHRKPIREQYLDFLVEKAQADNEQALAELRRMSPEPAAKEKATDAQVKPAERQADQGSAPIYRGAAITFLVAKNGDVTYQRDGRAMLRDAGRSVHMLLQDAQTIETGLRLALQKFGSKLALSGPPDFQERAARIAVDAGLKVGFSDPRLNKIMQDRRAELDAENAGKREARKLVPDPAKQHEQGKAGLMQLLAPGVPQKVQAPTVKPENKPAKGSGNDYSYEP